MLAMWFALTAHASSLEDAWRAAEGAEELVLAEEQYHQATLTRTQAYTSLTPRMQVNGNWTLNQREVLLDFAAALPPELAGLIGDVEPTVIQKKSFFDANASIIQPVLNVRSLWGLKAAAALVDAGDASRRAQRAELRLGVARAYWGVYVARASEEMAQQGITLAKRHAEQARALVAAGTATRQVELQADMAVARAERDLVDAAAVRGNAERAFAALVEVPADATLDEPALPDLPYATPEEAAARSRGRRPELQAAEAQDRAARNTATVSALAWAPTVDARFTEAWSQNTGFVGKAWNWQFVVTASWTPLDGGAKAVDNLRTASQARQADASAERMREQLEVDVASAWSERDRAGSALAAAERELSLAEENLRIAERSFDAGASTFLDLEDARVGRDGAKIRVLVERMNAHLGALALLRLTGDL